MATNIALDRPDEAKAAYATLTDLAPDSEEAGAAAGLLHLEATDDST